MIRLNLNQYCEATLNTRLFYSLKELPIFTNDSQSNYQLCIMMYAFFWVIPRRLNFISRRFGTLCSIFIKMEQVVFRNDGI